MVASEESLKCVGHFLDEQMGPFPLLERWQEGNVNITSLEKMVRQSRESQILSGQRRVDRKTLAESSDR